MKFTVLVSMGLAYVSAMKVPDADWSKGGKDLIVQLQNVAEQLSHVKTDAQKQLKIDLESKLANLDFNLDDAFEGTIYKTLKIKTDAMKKDFASDMGTQAKKEHALVTQNLLNKLDLTTVAQIKEKDSLQSYTPVVLNVIRSLQSSYKKNHQKSTLAEKIRIKLNVVKDNERAPGKKINDSLKAELVKAKINLVSLLLQEEEAIKTAMRLN